MKGLTWEEKETPALNRQEGRALNQGQRQDD